MSEKVSPWVWKVVGLYLILVVAGTLLGISSGGLGAIYIIPLLLPWIAIAAMIEGLGYGSAWEGPLIMVISGAINACILFLYLRFADKRRRRKPDTQSKPT